MRKERDSDGRKAAPRGRQRRRLRPVVFAAVGIVLLAGVAAAVFFWPSGSQDGGRAYALAPESALPDKVRQAPPDVREAYRFAIANRDILRKIPCYCGCGAEHQSNAECYIKDVRPDGRIQFDYMSLG